MFKNLSILFYLLVLNWVDSTPRKSRTFDEILSDRDVSSIVDDYQIEEDDPGLRNFLFTLGGNSTGTNSTNSGNATASGNRKTNSVRKGIKGSHDIRDRQGFYKLGGAHALGSIDDADFYIQKDTIVDGNQGADVREQKNYRRGSKTRGFHRIRHTDDFKKDMLFYDDKDNKGTLRRFGGKGVAYRGGAGGMIHKGRFHHDLEKGVFGKQGYFDQGSLDKQLEGFADSQGFDGAFNLNLASSALDSESDSNFN